MRPRFAEGSSSSMRTVIYIDSEVYVWLAAEFYDSGGLTATSMPLWRMRPSSEGGSLFDLAGSFYHPENRGSFFRSVKIPHPQRRAALPELARDFLDRRAPGLADSRSAGTGFERLNRRRKFRIAECESQRMIDRRVMEWL